MVRMLLRADAKPWLRDKKGFSALDYASMDGMHKSGQLDVSDHTPPPTQKTQSRRTKPGAPGAWTPMENTLLKAAVAQFGPEVPCRWDKVADKVGGGKTATECKKHLKALGK